MAMAAIQTERVSVSRARKICVLMTPPPVLSDLAPNGYVTEIRQ